MKPIFLRWMVRLVILVCVGLLALGWVVHFHSEVLAPHVSKDGWAKKLIDHFGKKAESAPAEDEDPDNTKNEIPVHTAHISVATLHRYVEGFGTVSPRPLASANIASSVAGVVAKVLCEPGKQVHAGDPLIQFDDRIAKAGVEQSQAAYNQAEASLAVLKANPRPDQVTIAQAAVQKAKSAVEFAQKNYDRMKQLASDQATPGKNLEQAAQDLSGAQSDLTVAQKQLSILMNTPTPEDLRAENAKVAQAAAALSAAKLQQQLLTLTAPIDGTVVSVAVNPGEAVDVNKSLVQLIALDRLMVDVDIPASQIPADAKGLSAEINLGQPVTCKITFVSPQIDPKTGSVQVGIDLPPDAKVRPGMSVRIRIIAEEHKDVLAVPREAVVADENGDMVIAKLDKDQATHKHVTTGLTENGLIEIQADELKEGDTVIAAGIYGLPQATHVKVLD